MEQVNFRKTIEDLLDTGFNPIPDTVRIAIPNAKEALWRGLKFFVGDSAQWLPEYDAIAEWLSDNKGKGLLCYGNCGRGKSLICCKIIPILLSHYCRKIVYCCDAQQMNANIDAVKAKHIICIDDIGTEEVSVKFGERRQALCEIADEAEKRGKMLLLTTNYKLGEIKGKYGERTVDRLVAIARIVNFSGKSLRG